MLVIQRLPSVELKISTFCYLIPTSDRCSSQHFTQSSVCEVKINHRHEMVVSTKFHVPPTLALRKGI
jgi:hypothetical protein